MELIDHDTVRTGELSIRIPKEVAEVRICGAIVLRITDDMAWIPPTCEQIKNLHDTLCIDVTLWD